MRSTGLLVFACATALTFAACNRDARDDARMDPANETGRTEVGTSGQTIVEHGVDGDARNFAQQASKHNAAEIELGKLASERAQSQDVKQFAQMMVQDHTKGLDALKQNVGSHGLQLNTELPDESEELMNKLRTLRGAEFDREYMDAMVKGHQEMKAMVSGRVDEAREEKTFSPLEAAANQWATNTLPTVERHLQKAQQIHDKLKSSGNSSY